MNLAASYQGWLDLVLFQVCWFGTVLGVNINWPGLGPLLVLGALTLHHAGMRNWTRELGFILLGGSAGYGLDVVLMNLGVLGFPSFSPPPGLAPFWLFTQWLIFCSLFHTTLDWMLDRPGLGALLGAAGGPISYGAAQRFGVLSLGPDVLTGLLILALVWAGVVPGLCYLARRVRPNPALP